MRTLQVSLFKFRQIPLSGCRKKSKISQTIKSQGGNHCFRQTPKNTNVIEDVGYFLSIKFTQIPFSGLIEKSKMWKVNDGHIMCLKHFGSWMWTKNFLCKYRNMAWVIYETACFIAQVERRPNMFRFPPGSTWTFWTDGTDFKTNKVPFRPLNCPIIYYIAETIRHQVLMKLFHLLKHDDKWDTSKIYADVR